MEHEADITICPKCRGEAARGRVASVPFPCRKCGSLIIGPYCDLSLIGSGAMGDVYRAIRAEMPAQPRALKIPRAADSESRRRFEREIAASAQLRHENIVRAIDCGDCQGFPYLVMELEQGQVLEWLVRTRGPFSADRVARLVRDVACGLALAERLRIVNRDIKPENLFVLDDGRTKILDYGLALLGDLAASATRTTPGTRLGTPAFMAPEQAVDCSRATILADIYSLGCTAYFALTGEPPFAGNVAETLQRHATALRPSATAKRLATPTGLDRLIQRMMAIDPRQRPGPVAVMKEIDGWRGVIPDHADVVAMIDTTPAAIRFADEVVGEVVEDEEPWVGEVVEEESEPWTGGDPPVQPPSQPPDPIPDPIPEAVAFPAVDRPSEVMALPASAIVDEQPEIPLFPASSVATPEPVPSAVAPTAAAPAASSDLRMAASTEAEPAMRVSKPSARGSKRETSSGRPKRSRRFRKAMGLTVVVLASAASLFWVAQKLNPGPTPDSEWQVIQDDYKLHRFKQVEKALAAFAAKYPTHARTAEVPFFEAMCQAGPHVFVQTAKPEEGLKRMREIFRKFRGTPEYERYCGDLFDSLKELTSRWVTLAEKTSRREALAGAEESFGLLSTVSKAMPDDWVPAELEKMSSGIQSARGKLDVALAREEFRDRLRAGTSRDAAGEDLDTLYADLKSLADRFPSLAQDAALQKDVEALRAGEANRVLYLPTEERDPAQRDTSERGRDPTAFVVWDEPTPPAGSSLGGSSPAGRIIVASVQGVLYAFRDTGEFVWARRLGIDSTRLPVPLEPSTAFPAALIAVSTIDNALLALEEATGEVLWRFRAGAEQDLAAPLTVCRWRSASDQPWRVRGLLPTVNGEVHVLDLVQGRPLGVYRTGFPMTVGGTYDAQRQLAFFPADRNRVFALDPAVIEGVSTPPARAVIFTKHGSGTLRSPPCLVGPYLILTEAADLDRSLVKAFFLREGTDLLQDPNQPPVAQFPLEGWSWFETPQTADRLTVLTDAGLLGVFGVNLDTPSEALYPLIAEDRGGLPRLPIAASYRALAIYSEEHLLWMMAGGTLRKVALDILNQRVATIWPKSDAEAEVVGIPLHEATVDRQMGRLYLATRSVDGSRVEFAAVDAETGVRLWSRQLGVNPLGEPLVAPRRAVWVDQSGRLLGVDLRPETPPAERLGLQPEVGAPPAGIRELNRIRDAEGTEYLVGTLRDGRGVAIRRLMATGEPASWRVLELVSTAMQGTPAVQGDHLVVPCADGRLHRLALTGEEQDRNAQTIAWSGATPHADDTPRLFPLDADTLVLVTADNVRWLRHVAGDVGQWTELAPPFQISKEVRGAMAVNESWLFLADVAGNLYRLRRDGSLRSKVWSSAGRITGGPTVQGDRLLVVEDDRTLLAFDLNAPEDAWMPVWRVGPCDHRICGMPLGVGRGLVVTDEGGTIQGIRLADGKPTFSLELPSGVVPAAPAVLLERELILPVADGTIYRVPLDSRPPPNPAPGAAT